MIQIELPPHLRALARVNGRLSIEARDTPTRRLILDALEAQYPVLRGTIRDQSTLERRPFIRFFVCGEDWTHELPNRPLPAEIAEGKQPFKIVGAMAGG